MFVIKTIISGHFFYWDAEQKIWQGILQNATIYIGDITQPLPSTDNVNRVVYAHTIQLTITK